MLLVGSCGHSLIQTVHMRCKVRAPPLPPTELSRVGLQIPRLANLQGAGLVLLLSPKASKGLSPVQTRCLHWFNTSSAIHAPTFPSKILPS